MRRIHADFPPSKDLLSTLKQGEYIVYIGVEDEVGIHPPADIPAAIQEKLTLAKRFRRNEGHVPANVIDTLPVEKMLMYELLHHTPPLSDMLESTPPDQYYDGDMLEFRLRPCTPGDITHRRAMLHKEILNKVDHYELGKYVYHGKAGETQPCAPFFPHVNISVWDKNGNLMDSEHPGYNTTYLRVIEQIVDAAMKPNNPIGMSLAEIRPIPQVGNGRYSDLRTAGTGDNARLEIRNTRYMANFPQAVTELCTAIERGMNPGKWQGRIFRRPYKLEMHQRAHFEREDSEPPEGYLKRTSKILRQMLNGGILDAQGHIHLDREALEHCITACADLFPGNTSFQQAYGSNDYFTAAFSHALQSRLESISIQSNGTLTMLDVKEWRRQYVRELVEEYCTLASQEQRGIIVGYLNHQLDQGSKQLRLYAQMAETIPVLENDTPPTRADLFGYALHPLPYLSDDRLTTYLSEITCDGRSEVPVSIVNTRHIYR